MSTHTPGDYYRLARQCRDQATHSMSGPAGTMLALARSYEAKAREMERTKARDLESAKAQELERGCTEPRARVARATQSEDSGRPITASSLCLSAPQEAGLERLPRDANGLQRR